MVAFCLCVKNLRNLFFKGKKNKPNSGVKVPLGIQTAGS